MPKEVTLNIVDTGGKTNGKTFTILTEKKSFINSVIEVGKNNTITYDDMLKLQEAARRSGDAGVLESCDLGAGEKAKLAKLNGYSKYYDIKISQDRKYFEVTIKDVDWCMDPTLAIIKRDFGLKDGVLVKHGHIPHNNEGVIPDTSNGGSFDSIQISAGKTINIPVSEINISSSPCGQWSRLISCMD